MLKNSVYGWINDQITTELTGQVESHGTDGPCRSKRRLAQLEEWKARLEKKLSTLDSELKSEERKSREELQRLPALPLRQSLVQQTERERGEEALRGNFKDETEPKAYRQLLTTPSQGSGLFWWEENISAAASITNRTPARDALRMLLQEDEVSTYVNTSNTLSKKNNGKVQHMYNSPKNKRQISK